MRSFGTLEQDAGDLGGTEQDVVGPFEARGQAADRQVVDCLGDGERHDEREARGLVQAAAGRSSREPWKLPGGECQDRPWRPRPAIVLVRDDPKALGWSRPAASRTRSLVLVSSIEMAMRKPARLRLTSRGRPRQRPQP